MTHDEMIAVIQAHKDGKKIQVMGKAPIPCWVDERRPSFDFRNYIYRIAPEPRVIWVNEFKDYNFINSSQFIYPSKETAESRGREYREYLRSLKFVEVIE